MNILINKSIVKTTGRVSLYADILEWVAYIDDRSAYRFLAYNSLIYTTNSFGAYCASLEVISGRSLAVELFSFRKSNDTLYWTIKYEAGTTGADFTAVSGTVTLANHQYTLQVPTSSSYFSGSKSFSVELRIGSIVGEIVAESSSITLKSSLPANVKLSISGIGTNGSTVVNDDSNSHHTVTVLGDTHIYGNKILFPDSNAKLSIPNSSEFTIGTSNFSFKFDIVMPSTIPIFVFPIWHTDNATKGFSFAYYAGDPSLTFYGCAGGTRYRVSWLQSLTASTAYNIEISRISGVFRLTINNGTPRTDYGVNDLVGGNISSGDSNLLICNNIGTSVDTYISNLTLTIG